MSQNPTSDSNTTRIVPQPSVLTNRIDIVDIIRGVALLGILVLNISYFSMPTNFSESFRNDPSTFNFWVMMFNGVFFEGKMRALFSAIFGAGIILFTINKERTGRSATKLFYIRMAWLAAFGLVHAHLLLWVGDILYFYGLIGMLAFLFRKMKPAYLMMGVPIVIVVGFVAGSIYSNHYRQIRLNYNEALVLKETGDTLSEKHQNAIVAWETVEREMIPNEKTIAERTDAMKGSYADVAGWVRKKAFESQTKYFIFGLWDMLALMLLGIALYKIGFFTGQWSRKQYLRTLLVGYGLGLPMVIFSRIYYLTHMPDIAATIAFFEKHAIDWVALLYDFQRILIMMAHVSLFILVYQAGYLKWLMHALKAVGQMAFTNYIMHTVFCTLFFYGYGLNYFAELEYYQVYFVLTTIWIIQLIGSPLWLKYFLFGPLEWAWRCLTYRKVFAFKRNMAKEYKQREPEVVPAIITQTINE
ncbi:MAG: DUF418 domain-containing protein [Bacteroidetes bacterium]|nr:MAG: DUF418 domain-containing protein [Bacteroidota bacterium]